MKISGLQWFLPRDAEKFENEVFSYPVTIFSASLKTETSPIDWMDDKVTHIFKKGSISQK